MVFLSVLLATGFPAAVVATTSASQLRNHARDLHKRAEMDCGTWTMFCGGTPNGGQKIEGACNNACFYINVIKGGDYTVTYRTDTDQARNRHQSGCDVASNHGGSTSVCRLMPFSQKLGDPVDDVNCDEFPMADMVQPDFQDVNSLGEARNALRCITGTENQAAGAQFNNFIQGQGSGLEGRTCTGPMNDPNTDYKFKVAFNTDNTAASAVAYCDGVPNNELDFQQFFMTHLAGNGEGENNFPMNWDLDSHYAIANQARWQEIEQCRIELVRTSGDTYTATMFDVDNQQVARKQQALNNDGDRLQLDPTGGFAHLYVIRTGEIGNSGTPGSRVDFEYRVHTDGGSDPLIDWQWTTESTGRDTRYSAARQQGGYCEVQDIIDDDTGIRQTINCYFYCPQVPA